MSSEDSQLQQALSAYDDAPNWHRALAEAIREPEELLALLQLDEELLEPARRAAALFPLLVPRSYLARMRPADPDDPLLRQVLPLADEEAVFSEFVADAVGDAAAHRAPGLLQKYAGRALLITTGACAIHCRYCFRRSYPYGEEPRRLEDWEPAFSEIAADESLSEIILSGGDPLMLTDARLAAFLNRLDQIPHLRRLRIHTRLPIVLPQRVTEDLLALLTSTRLTPIIAGNSKPIVRRRFADWPAAASRCSTKRCCCGASMTVPRINLTCVSGSSIWESCPTTCINSTACRERVTLKFPKRPVAALSKNSANGSPVTPCRATSAKSPASRIRRCYSNSSISGRMG